MKPLFCLAMAICFCLLLGQFEQVILAKKVHMIQIKKKCFTKLKV